MALLRTLIAVRFVTAISCLVGLLSPVFAQHPPVRGSDIPTMQTTPITVKICVRDARGLPLEFPAFVHLHSVVGSYDVKSATGEGAAASFQNVAPGDYEVEVRATGYQTKTEPVTVVSFGGDFSVYIYLQNEASSPTASLPPGRVVMSPKLQNEIEKGLAAARKKEYAVAQTHFVKASKMAPGNPDVLYLLGTSELGLRDLDAARLSFNSALNIEPSNQRVLLALAEIDLETGDTSSAIMVLEKAFDLNGADWRIHFLLATAYARAGRFSEAETHAERGVRLAGEKGAPVVFLLGEIQFAEHKNSAAKQTWERLLGDFPNDPSAQKAKIKLQILSRTVPEEPSVNVIGDLPLPQVVAVGLVPLEEGPWAPPDIDSREYRVANGVGCNLSEVLARANQRLDSQLMNFEKFSATERIEHQQVNRYGVPGVQRSKEFSYIVFVHKGPPGSFYLEEDRLEGNDLSTFPTPLATTGLNSLGVSILQAATGSNYQYRCEGLTSVRGEATWQIRFEQAKDSSNSIREWRKNGQIVDLPLKGRFWLSTSNYDLLRVETDLIRPVIQLELTMDHLLVDYGPVTFESGNATLWLPWSAEMFMQLHGNRYHHKHYLTNYYLFSVDSNHRISAPKDASTIPVSHLLAPISP